jgi:pimeloyl-ACP methyl ester carboxylesterase
MQARERYAAATASSVAVNEVIDTVSQVQRAALNRIRKVVTPTVPASDAVFDLVEMGIRSVAVAAKGIGWTGANVVAPVLATTTHPDATALTSSEKGSKWVAGFGAAFGDHLHNSVHTRALAPGMTLRYQGDPGTVSEIAAASAPVSGHVCLFIHGLGLTEQHWGKDIVAAPATAGATSVQVRYTTGIPITDNGDQFAKLIADLVKQWPTPVTRITIVGHSMGGLVGRRAIEILSQTDPPISDRIQDLVTLGSPHKGSAIEKGANLALIGLSYSSILAPLVALGNRRSAGVKDLRHGAIRPTDWGDRHRDGVISDQTQTVSLPDTTDHHAVIATVHDNPNHITSWLVGDGAVRVGSAKPRVDASAKSTTLISATSHMRLLSHPRVAELIREILTAPTDPVNS